MIVNPANLAKPDRPDPDDALMHKAAQNNADAFGVLVRAHEMHVSRFALRLLNGDRDAAQDVAQETFLRVWRSRRAYVPSGSFSTYLLRIAHRLCLDALRQARSCTIIAPPAASGGASLPFTPFVKNVAGATSSQLHNAKGVSMSGILVFSPATK